MATDETPQAAPTQAETDSLETLEGATPSPPTANTNQPGEPVAKPPRRQWRSKRPSRVNFYLLAFVAIILIAAGVIIVAYLQSRHVTKSSQLTTQSLSQSALEQLAKSDATVGSNQTVLNVQSSAVFAGQVLIRQNLEVAGNLQLGGTLALNALAVTGASQLGQASVSRNLAVTGDTAIQGATTIGKSLQVTGPATFNGAISAPQITTSNLTLSGDLVLTHHITTGGGTPSRSGGPAVGSGGTVSLSGSDTAGSISVNTGGSPAAGCFLTVTFTSAFSATPHVMVTPIGSAAGGLDYYVNHSNTSFSICDATAPPTGSSFGFDYFVLD